jgi:gliding motility-associated-like protein
MWDTSLYPLADLGDTELCKLYTGYKRNEFLHAFCLKGVECSMWVPWRSFSGKYAGSGGSGAAIPGAYKNCYPNLYPLDHSRDPQQPLSETFISTSVYLDTLKRKYTGGKFFLYMPLGKSLIQGKTYKLDFDIKSMLLSNNCAFDTTDPVGCSGFGIGFTEKTPDFIQDPVTYETDLVPKVKLGFFNTNKWTHISQYIVADSNYKFIIIGFYDKIADFKIYSKNRNCDVGNLPNEIRSTILLDNLFLKEISDTLLPRDTSLCLGKELTIPCLQNKLVNWAIDGQALPGKSFSQKVTVNNALITVIATDSVISDTMFIHGVPYPTFNIIQTDTLCNEISVFSAEPHIYKYFWIPENVYTQTIQVSGDAPRQVIGTDSIGCADTADFIPVLGTGICGTYFIPSAFTPNDDGSNEGFGVIGSGIQNVEMKIYNTWGEELFSGDGAKTTWNGFYQGRIVPQGIYLYKITVSYFKNGKTIQAYLSGTLNLLL